MLLNLNGYLSSVGHDFRIKDFITKGCVLQFDPVNFSGVATLGVSIHETFPLFGIGVEFNIQIAPSRLENCFDLAVKRFDLKSNLPGLFPLT